MLLTRGWNRVSLDLTAASALSRIPDTSTYWTPRFNEIAG